MTPIPKKKDESLSFDEKLDRIQRYLPKGITEKILSQREKIEGERRQVTIMFCDMTASMSLTEKLGAEDSFLLMDQIYEILIHKVHEYEGTVNELRGDGILALFGAPIALEDAPQRALRSALAIQREMTKFNESNRDNKTPPIRLRIGINSGPVVVGAVGNDLRVQFTAVGDTINMAARMEGLAEPGTTFLAEDTFKLTKDLFQFEALGKKKIKGKKKTVPVYKLISSREDIFRPRLGSERAIYSEMVGRASQLDRLELQIMKAINGEGSVVNIIGEAGIGKSRLVAEVMKRDVMKRVTLFEGRAIAIGRNLSFHPITDLLKQWVQIRHADGEAVAFNKLEAAIRGLYPEGNSEVLPFVATLMGMKLSGRYSERVKGIEGEALEKLILKNVRDLMVKATESTPLVIVIEDLHWADTSSIEMMESLFRLAETQRILFVNLFRPGHTDTGDRLIETLKERLPVYYVEIRLEPLDERKSEALINNMLSNSGLHHTAIGQVVRRSGGNPFFIEEVVRSFIDEGVIVFKNGSFRETERIDTITVPCTINDVLMARIDRLEDQTRELVKIASVIGRNFFFRVLSDVASSVDDIDGKLSYLTEIQLVLERERMGELEYIFKHALIQETAYESILPKQRKKLHLQVARSIEKVFAERIHEFYGMLAYHYSRADNLEKTEEFLIKAGEEALKSSASVEALKYYREALELFIRQHGEAGDPDKLAMLEKNIAITLFNKFQHVKAIEYFDSALDRLGAGSPKNKILMIFKLIFNIISVITNLYYQTKKARMIPEKHDNELFDLIQKRVIALTYIDPNRFFFETLVMLRRFNKFDVAKIENGITMYSGASALFSFTGISFKLSKKALEVAKIAIRKKDFKSILYYDLFELMHNFLKGNWDNIREFDKNLLNLNLSVGEFWPVSIYFGFFGVMKIEQGDFKEVELIIRELSENSAVYENENFLINLYTIRAKFLLKRRKLQEAKVEVDTGIAFDIQTGVELQHLYFLGFKASICILLMDIDGAKLSLSQGKAIQLMKGRVPPFFISSYLMSQFLYDLFLLEKSSLSQDKSNIAKYRKKAHQNGKNALRNSFKYSCDRTEALRLMGVYHWLIGNQDKAVKWWNKSIAEGERLGARVELARTFMEIGKRLLKKESRFYELNGIKGVQYLEKARVLFEQMDLQWDLDEIEAVLTDR